MVFCYQNCSDLLWEKTVLVIEKKLLKFEAEGQELAKILRSLEQSIQTPVLYTVALYSQVSIKQASSLNYFEEIFHPARSY